MPKVHMKISNSDTSACSETNAADREFVLTDDRSLVTCKTCMNRPAYYLKSDFIILNPIKKEVQMIQKRATTDDKTIMKVSKGMTHKPKRTRRPAVPKGPLPRGYKLDYHVVVDKRVQRAAKTATRVNERFVPVDETTMRSVYVDPDKRALY